MSASEIADYVSFRRAQRDLSGLADWYPTINVDSQLSYFKDVERGIAALRTYSEISDMEESERVLNAAIAGKRTRSWVFGSRREKLADEIHYCLPPVLREAGMVALKRMPPRNPAMKGRIVDLIRRLYDLKENMPEIPAGECIYFNSEELFLGPHGATYSELVGMASELLSVDPLVAVESHYNAAREYLYPEKDDKNKKKLENLMQAIASFDALFGTIKTYHGITDYDTGRLKDIMDMQKTLSELQDELEISEAANRRLLQYSPAAPKSRYEPSSIAPVEESIALLSGFVDESTVIKDGKLELNPNVETLERIFNSIKTKLESTSFLVLYGQAQDSLDGVQKSHGDPVTLMRLAKVYKHMATMTLDTQVERSNRKENIRRLLPDPQGV
jgi:hypothetical protein